MFHHAVGIGIGARVTVRRHRELMNAHFKAGGIRGRIHVRAGGITGRNRGVGPDEERVRARIMPAVRSHPSPGQRVG